MLRKFILTVAVLVAFALPLKDVLASDYSRDDYMVARYFEACEQGRLEEVKRILSEQGLEVNVYGRQGWTGLHAACEGKQLEIARFLLEKGADINARDQSGYTPLHIACFYRSPNIVKMLLEKGANMYFEGSEGQTPFFEACRRQYLDTMQIFLDKGVDVNWQNLDGETALMAAIDEGAMGAAELLLSNKAIKVNLKTKRGETALYKACYYKEGLDLVKQLLAKGADMSLRNNDGHNALEQSCRYGNLEIVNLLCASGADYKGAGTGSRLLSYACENNTAVADLLLKKGLDINVKDQEGRNALMLECANYDLEAAKYLIKKGININATDNKGMNALHYACSSGRIKEHQAEIIRLLVSAGVNPSNKNTLGQTPLHLLSVNGLDELLPIISQFAIQINAKDNAGNTPLHVAITKKTFVYLVLLGGDVTIKNNKGQPANDPSIKRTEGYEWNETPLQLPKSKLDLEERLLFACNNQLDLVVRTLIIRGADVRATNQAGATPLHLIDDPENLKLLLQKGANINAADHGGQTPFMYAAKEGNKSKIELLLDKGADPNILNNKGETALDVLFDPEDERLGDLISARGGAVGSYVRENLKNKSDQIVKGPKLDSSDVIRRLIGNYEQALVDSINNNQFSYVEGMLTPGSNLYRTQKTLVSNLAQQKVKEKILEYQVVDIQTVTPNELYRVFVIEKAGIKYPGKDYMVKEYSWIYTVEVNQRKYTLSKLEKWERNRK